jgi:hypothetical protein
MIFYRRCTISLANPPSLPKQNLFLFATLNLDTCRNLVSTAAMKMLQFRLWKRRCCNFISLSREGHVSYGGRVRPKPVDPVDPPAVALRHRLAHQHPRRHSSELHGTHGASAAAVTTDWNREAERINAWGTRGRLQTCAWCRRGAAAPGRGEGRPGHRMARRATAT